MRQADHCDVLRLINWFHCIFLCNPFNDTSIHICSCVVFVYIWTSHYCFHGSIQRKKKPNNVHLRRIFMVGFRLSAAHHVRRWGRKKFCSYWALLRHWMFSLLQRYCRLRHEQIVRVTQLKTCRLLSLWRRKTGEMIPWGVFQRTWGLWHRKTGEMIKEHGVYSRRTGKHETSWKWSHYVVNYTYIV